MRHIYIPFLLKKTNNRSKSQGGGMGSVLLQRGGPGAASSYPSVDSYVETTGRTPFKSQAAQMSTGFGVGLKSKIRALIPSKKHSKKPNINFSM
jgi:hypothetical protein